MKKKETKYKSGFTLVEMLIALIVVGILAGMLMISSGSATDRAEKTRCTADRRSLLSALNLYRAQHGVINASNLSAALTNTLDNMFDNHRNATVNNNIVSGICLANGRYVASVSEDKLSVGCTVHDGAYQDSNIILALATINEEGSNKTALKEHFDTYGSINAGTRAYLDSINQKAENITSLLENQLGFSLAGYTWMAVDFGGNNQDYSVYLTNENLNNYNAGDYITVTKYETSTGKVITITTKVGLDSSGNKVLCHVATADKKIAINNNHKRT
ncbi:MAG: type II secretion system protein [Synergistaceae bacterium]|nr:type II secretion system protein [Synergistaceae bacterium]